MKDGPVGVVPKDGSGTFSPFGQPPPEGPVGVRPRENAGCAEGEMPQRGGGQGIWDHLGWLEKGGKGGKGPPPAAGATASGVRPKAAPSGVRPKQPAGEL